MRVQSLGQRDPPVVENGSHASILPWKSPQTEGSLVGYSPSEVAKS